MTVIVKIVPAHAVPAWPVPVGLMVNTPGSASAAGQSLVGATPKLVPHAGTMSMVVMVTLEGRSAPLEVLVIVKLAGTLVWPTVTDVGNSGTTPKPTPAKAAGMETAKGTNPIASAIKPWRNRRPVLDRAAGAPAAGVRPPCPECLRSPDERYTRPCPIANCPSGS